MDGKNKMWAIAATRLAQVVVLICACFVGVSAAAQSTLDHKRYALVIGIQSYERARDLRNPANDARAVAARLQAMGYALHEGAPLIDPDRERLLQAFTQFARSVPPGARVVVYVAGHGLTHQGNSYLVPSDDGQLQSREDLDSQGVALRVLTGRLAARTGVNSLILVDACSANGLRGEAAGTSGIGASGAGGSGDLVASANGSMALIYAAAPGQIAADGAAENSPFAQALLEALHPDARPAHELFGVISQRMGQLTNGAQIPWMMQALGGSHLGAGNAR
jgi:uncharacterized caspase-like protein